MFLPMYCSVFDLIGLKFLPVYLLELLGAGPDGQSSIMFHKSNLLLSTLFICHEEKMEISRDHSSEQHNTYIRPIARYVNACKYHGLSKEHSFVMTYFTSTMDISDYLHKVTESEACYEWPSRIAIILESIMENVWFIFISYLQ